MVTKEVCEQVDKWVIGWVGDPVGTQVQGKLDKGQGNGCLDEWIDLLWTAGQMGGCHVYDGYMGN